MSGTHTYAYAGTYPLSITLTNLSRSGHTQTLRASLTVQQAPLSGSGLEVSAVEGTAFVGTLASFTSPNTNLGASSFSVSINWGDGATSAGSVVSTSTLGSFQVRGSHSYVEAGSYPVSVTISISGSPVLLLATTVTVSDAALSGYGGFVSGTHGVALASTTAVATLRDADSAAPASDFTAVIDWGDGSRSLGW